MSDEKRLEQFIDSLGLRYFKGAELTPYWSRTRRGVSNSCPPDTIWANIVPTVVVLDEIRHIAGHRIDLTSTYRDLDYNRAVGGAARSFHMSFMAIDFRSYKVKPARLAEIARSLRGKRFKNPNTGGTFIFRGGIEEYSSFVHVDTRGKDVDW